MKRQIEGFSPGGLIKSCPKYRALRGIANSFILNGFDNFVDQISKMKRDTNNSSNSNSDDELIQRGQIDNTLTIFLPADD